MTNLEILLDVKIELDRFNEKFTKALQEQSIKDTYTSKKLAACKRSALDLKHELTKLTQMSKYKYPR